MSWQEGDGPDPADEVDGSTNPLADYAEGAYLSAAAAWLVKVERARTPYLKAADNSFTEFTTADRLAELNIAMATACGAYQDRQPRVEVKQPDWLAPAQPYRLAKTPDEVAAEIREHVQAYVEAHQAETLRPGIDPEPPEDGALWTADGEYFAFAAFPLEREIQRWLIIRRYTEALRWHNDYPNNFITADTWEGLDGKIGYADDAPLRRPTAAERAAFYGPEPDPTADNTLTPPEAASVTDLWAFTDQAGTAVAELDNDQLGAFDYAIRRLLFDRGYVLQNTPLDAAAKWREG